MTDQPKASRRPTGRRLAAAIVCAVAVLTLALYNWPSRQPTPTAATASTIRDALVDLMQPGRPYPLFAESTRSPSAPSIARAAVALRDVGEPEDKDRVNEQVVGDYLKALGELKDPKGEKLPDVAAVVRLQTDGGKRPLPAAQAEGVKKYVGGLTLGDESAQDALPIRLALLSRIQTDIRLTSPDYARAVASTLTATIGLKCSYLSDQAKKTDIDVLGRLLQAVHGIQQPCLNEQQLKTAISNADTDPARNSLPATRALADLVQDGIHGPWDTSTEYAQAGERSLQEIAQALTKSPAALCYADSILQAVDVGIQGKPGTVSIPPAVTGCLQRELRWHGSLPDTMLSPTPFSLAFGVAALRGADPTHDQTALLQSLLGTVDLNAPTLQVRDRLILSLVLQKEISSDLVTAFAASADPSSAQDITVLTAAAARAGACPPQVLAATTKWAHAVGAGSTGRSSILWGVYAARNASTCLGPDNADLAAVRQTVHHTVATMSSTGGTANPTLIALITEEAKCVGRDTRPTTGSASSSSPGPQEDSGVWDDTVGAQPPSVLELFALTRLEQLRDGMCRPTWLTAPSNRKN